ncbi:DNA mismatch endonuclease, patch repair protein [Nitrosomonas sp. Nm132]|nr:DNA mismatch endonuclease, patch repair protein [Nitrosomonas sp. Nm132]
MAAVKSRDTGLEIIVRRLLHASGFRFRLHRKDLPGKPDIVLPKYRTVILVHGCFWHQHPECKYSSIPATRQDYWQAKLNRNVLRDQKNTLELTALGWKVFIIWECEIKDKMTFSEKIHQLLSLRH